MKNLMNKVYQSAKNVEKKTARALAIASLGIVSLVPYSAKAQSPVLDDYLSTTTTDVYHVSVNKLTPENPTGQVWEGIPNFTGLNTALRNNYSTSTSLPVRLHIMPGEWINENNPSGPQSDLIIPSNMQIVGQSNSIVGSDYKEGIAVPTEGVFIRRKTKTLPGVSNISLVNLIFNPSIASSECLELDGSTSYTIHNNFIAGRYNSQRISNGLTIGQNTIANLNNNVTYQFYNGDVGVAIAIRGEAKLNNNIIAEAGNGIDVYNTAKLDLGTEEVPGNNVFLGNKDWNIKANIGDIGTIKAERNTWYPINKIDLSLASINIIDYGNPLKTNEEIQLTNLVENPGAPIRPQKNEMKLQAAKEIDTYPFNFGDSRFGYVAPNAVKTNWEMYE